GGAVRKMFEAAHVEIGIVRNARACEEPDREPQRFFAVAVETRRPAAIKTRPTNERRKQQRDAYRDRITPAPRQQTKHVHALTCFRRICHQPRPPRREPSSAFARNASVLAIDAISSAPSIAWRSSLVTCSLKNASS